MLPARPAFQRTPKTLRQVRQFTTTADTAASVRTASRYTRVGLESGNGPYSGGLPLGLLRGVFSCVALCSVIA